MTHGLRAEDSVDSELDHSREQAGGTHDSGGLHGRVLELFGMALCSGELTAGTVIRIDQLESRYGASRSVIREVLRVVASMGMVAMNRRVGVRVQPADDWNLFDPRIIRWRLGSADRKDQLRSLTELRAAVEPEAARLAASRASLRGASDLVATAGRLWAAGSAGESDEFLRLDVDFHRQVLVASGNEMFAKLHGLVGEVLTGRARYDLMPEYPHQEALQLHADVASAIQRGAPDSARDSMLAIMERAMSEMSGLWTKLSSPEG